MKKRKYLHGGMGFAKIGVICESQNSAVWLFCVCFLW